MKSFCFETTQDMPASCGVTVPSVSWPTMMKPFSARRTCMVSVPYGVMPYGWPASSTCSQTARPYHAETLIS